MSRKSTLFLSIAALGACSGGGDVAEPDASSACSDLETAMVAGLDAAGAAQPPFTLLLETVSGRRFAHSVGDSSATTVYASASTSKWVTAVVILEQVDQGRLSLDTTAHELLPYWAETAADLRDLMSFTSGFGDEPLCIDAPGADFDSCVQAIYDKNSASAPAPGAEFEYSSTHLQVAGAMAIAAAGESSWGAVFDGFRARTGLFPTGAYDLPSASNPRLAGGMHWTGEEYLGFLRALVHGDVLSDASRAALFADQRAAAAVVASPIAAGLGEDWSYGLGNWLECTSPSFDCGAGHRNSSPGAYGAYPFIDADAGYVGILARQGALGTGDDGVRLFRAVADLADQWAACE
jgi:CubicO group peptidase (beta-lactamase class C family)